MAAVEISKKEYLKKYLSGDKKKRKKKPNKVGNSTIKIIDDDIDLKNMKPIGEDELDLYNLTEDGPQIAGIVDERPEEVRVMTEYRGSKKWKIVAHENGDDDVLKVSAVNHLVGGRDSDVSVERRNTKNSDTDSDNSPPRKHTDTKTDFPNIKPLRNDESTKHHSKTKVDVNSLRREKSDSDASPPRKISKKDNNHVRRHAQDSDLSPPRKSSKKDNNQFRRHTHEDSDPSPPRKSSKKDNNKVRRHTQEDSDASPPRKSSKKDNNQVRRHTHEDSDPSPPRKSSKKDNNQVRRHTHEDSDPSPPRKRVSELRKDKKYSKHRTFDENISNFNSSASPNRSRSHKQHSKHRSISSSSDSDNEHRKSRKRESLQRNSQKSDSDESPSRSNRENRDTINGKHSHKANKQGDFFNDSHYTKNRDSERSAKLLISERGKRNDRRDNDDSLHNAKYSKHRSHHPNDEGKSAHNSKDSKGSNEPRRAEKTLDGKRAGLQNAEELKKETSAYRKRQEDVFLKMTDDVSGRNATAIVRDRKTGRKKDLEEEKIKNRKAAELAKVTKEKYDKWGKGLKQVKDRENRIKEDLYEMSKPLARYADDKDLDNMLKDQDREGDPMLEYIQQKREEEGTSKPVYKGSFLPNRYGIRPGHKWDGVDRSNGFEKKWFEEKNARKAREEEAFKWSTADM